MNGFTQGLQGGYNMVSPQSRIDPNKMPSTFPMGQGQYGAGIGNAIGQGMQLGRQMQGGQSGGSSEKDILMMAARLLAGMA